MVYTTKVSSISTNCFTTCAEVCKSLTGFARNHLKLFFVFIINNNLIFKKVIPHLSQVNNKLSKYPVSHGQDPLLYLFIYLINYFLL